MLGFERLNAHIGTRVTLIVEDKVVQIPEVTTRFIGSQLGISEGTEASAWALSDAFGLTQK
jgi:extradiol dioxygenase family protein